jgi:hypothetical protein
MFRQLRLNKKFELVYSEDRPRLGFPMKRKTLLLCCVVLSVNLHGQQIVPSSFASSKATNFSTIIASRLLQRGQSATRCHGKSS